MAGSPVWIHGIIIILALSGQLLSEFFTAPFNSIVHPTFHGNESRRCSIDASMDTWAISIWIMLSVWNTVWLMYAFSTVVRSNILGPVCCNPEVHPPLFYLMWIFITSVRITSWLLGDDPCLAQTFGLKILIPLLTYMMLGISYSNLQRHQPWLTTHSPKDFWCISYLIQNGLAMFATWTWLEALMIVGAMLKFKAGLQDPLASTVVLTLLLVSLITWFALESFLFERYMRYTFTVYPMMILGLGAIFTKIYQFDDISPNTVYCGVLMILATLLNTIGLIMVCCYKDRKPSFLSQDRTPQEDVPETTARAKDCQSAAEGEYGIVNIQFSKD
ncbi:hypothetical protein GN956_G14171 [Arapaima gigas]